MHWLLPLLVLTLPPRDMGGWGFSGESHQPGVAGQLEAKELACRAVVMAALGTLSPPPSPGMLVELGPAFADSIGGPCRYLLKFDVESEEPVAGGGSRIRLRNCMVNMETLSVPYLAAVAALRARSHPKVLLLLSERSAPGEEERSWWVGIAGAAPSFHFSLVEQVVSASLSSRGWQVVGPESARKLASGKVIIKGNQPSSEEAVAYARKVGVDYVVFGRATFGNDQNSGVVPMSVVSAHLEAKVVRTGNADVVAGVADDRIVSTPGSASVAVLKAGDILAEKLDLAMASTVLTDWQRLQSGTAPIEIEVAAPDYGLVLSLVAWLRTQPGVKDVAEGDFANGKVHLTVSSAGAKPQALAQAAGHATDLKLKVLRVSDADLSLRVNP